MSSGARSQMRASTLARDVQVGQYHQNEHDLRIKKVKPKHKSAPLRYSSIQVQFEETPQPSCDQETAVEPPEHDEEDDSWLDEPRENIPHVSGPLDLDTFAVITHPRITAVLARLTEDNGKKSAVPEKENNVVEEPTVKPADDNFDFSFN
ncbi:hypothetical protein BDZ89DRAFT_1162825 [Hymenopellis radicata]|nr:hypothetical protein BDZ89DRAFT_1162825 [Hymenopellis radicata]